jgi:hypothetical protein
MLKHLEGSRRPRIPRQRPVGRWGRGGVWQPGLFPRLCLLLEQPHLLHDQLVVRGPELPERCGKVWGEVRVWGEGVGEVWERRGGLEG